MSISRFNTPKLIQSLFFGLIKKISHYDIVHNRVKKY